MLMYHPLYDANHCIYRMLLILEATSLKQVDWEMFRLLDFYLLFPHVLKDIKPFPSKLRKYRKTILNIQDAYEALPNSKRVLYDLECIQDVAIHNLLAKDLVDMESFQNKCVARTSRKIPATLLRSIKESEYLQKGWFEVVVNELPLVEFYGPQGIKARSGLMEYKYDCNEVAS